MNFLKRFLNLAFFVSPIDAFLKNYDKTHPKLSASQRAEKEKYARIYALRDKPGTPVIADKKLWDNF